MFSMRLSRQKLCWFVRRAGKLRHKRCSCLCQVLFAVILRLIIPYRLATERYLHFFFQREPTVQLTAHMIVGDGEVSRKLLTAPDYTRIAAIQKLHTEHTIFHPLVGLGNLGDFSQGAREHLLEVVKVVPGFKQRAQTGEA